MGSTDSNSNNYSNMPGYPFITKCPACENNDNITWCHASDEGLETIDDIILLGVMHLMKD